jgi:hypothetical protein
VEWDRLAERMNLAGSFPERNGLDSTRNRECRCIDIKEPDGREER